MACHGLYMELGTIPSPQIGGFPYLIGMFLNHSTIIYFRADFRTDFNHFRRFSSSKILQIGCTYFSFNGDEVYIWFPIR